MGKRVKVNISKIRHRVKKINANHSSAIHIRAIVEQSKRSRLIQYSISVFETKSAIVEAVCYS